MSIKTIMTTKIYSLSINHTIRDAITIMKNNDIGLVIILDEEIVKGIITDRDIALALINFSIDDKIIKIMKRNVIYINENSSIYEAADNCAYFGITRLLVINNDNELKGIISIFDLLAIDAYKDYVVECLRELKLNNNIYHYEIENDINISRDFF